MKRIIAVLCLCVFMPAGAFDLLTQQQVDDFYKYYDQCKKIRKQFKASDEKYWCNEFYDNIRHCSKAYPKNPLKEYTKQENSQRNRNIIECTRILIEW